jgi:hypothetical protein
MHGLRLREAAELHRDPTVRASLRGDVVQVTGVVGVRLKITLCIVEADRPEGVDGNLFDVEPLESLAAVPARRDIRVCRLGFARPQGRCAARRVRTRVPQVHRPAMSQNDATRFQTMQRRLVFSVLADAAVERLRNCTHLQRCAGLRLSFGPICVIDNASDSSRVQGDRI